MDKYLEASYKDGNYGYYPHYTLFVSSTSDDDEGRIYGILAQYDEKTSNVYLVCKDDKTVNTYHKAYTLFRRMAGF